MTLIRLGPDTRPGQRRYRPEAPAPREQVPYHCDRGHDFEVTFAAGAEQPQAAGCRCGAGAHRAGTASAAAVSNADAEHERHRRHVHERRTPAEREAALADRLAEVAVMRKAGKL